ncbi:hydrolase or acyltransferase (alpha/beta hydrolase superfamily) [Fusarium flagelliforme]|uniref:Hydrolase or acyltransferase (Alpha/beta hydrolase superfamily) n=1 Tax=Fusarium flagelliforme TaxID=2675880 RepID=A0A395MED0_9HYPO|nr:hydrolase or acyltransferase (alpha/beta hydrolase superfamily) [Fusarium flagelliforme]
MKLQSFLLSNVLLHSTQAFSLPDDVHAALTPRTDSEKPSIEWSECDLDFGDLDLNTLQRIYDCATLEVPLDYMNSSDVRTIKLDLIRAKATKKPFKGSVLFNPGGPGGSGVEAVLLGATQILPIIGGHHDLIGFDPRGTGRTIPFDCPSLDEWHTLEDSLHRRELHTFPQYDAWEDIKTTWKKAGEVAQACWEDHRDTGRFVGTPFVARDMISIVDALGQGDKLNYWGSSYGTVLGQVAASMFPKRVGRILLDANLNADDYAAGTWLTGAIDTERTLANLFNDCVMSGKDLCSLADFHGKSTTGESLMNTFREVFKPVEGTKSEDAQTLYLFKRKLFKHLYDPSQYPSIVKAIEPLFTGDKPYNCTLRDADPTTEWNPQPDRPLSGIACSDSSLRVEDVDDFFSLAQCSNWKFSAAEPINLNKLCNVNTSNPILVINGRYDPITSLRSAWEVSTKFRGSRVVVHEGAGHGLIAHPSNCTNNIVVRYFIDGEMPKMNTTCSPDETAFQYADRMKALGKAMRKALDKALGKGSNEKDQESGADRLSDS